MKKETLDYNTVVLCAVKEEGANCMTMTSEAERKKKKKNI